MNRRALVSGVWVLGNLLTLVAHGQSCPAKPDFGEKVRRYTGHYENAAYGFSVDLPQGLVGLDTDDPDHQRGFAIVLPDGGGWIWVFADTNSADDSSLRRAVEIDIWELRKRTERVDAPIYAGERLGGLPAQKVVAQFMCKGSSVRYGIRSVEAMDHGKRFVYNLAWEGPASGAASSERMMRALERSWRFIPAR